MLSRTNTRRNPRPTTGQFCHNSIRYAKRSFLHRSPGGSSWNSRAFVDGDKPASPCIHAVARNVMKSTTLKADLRRSALEMGGGSRKETYGLVEFGNRWVDCVASGDKIDFRHGGRRRMAPGTITCPVSRFTELTIDVPTGQWFDRF